jgi:hypothetical protein
LKKKKNFLIGNQLRSEFGAAQPDTAHAACVAQLVVPRAGGSRAQNPRGEVEPNPLSKSTR